MNCARRFWVPVLTAALLCNALISASIGQDAGVSSKLSAQITDALQPFVADKEIAGAVTLVASSSGVLNVTTIGKSDLSSAQPMDAQSIFWIASMTKPVTGVAVMMLKEQGKLNLDDPVEKYLPEYKQLKDSDGKAVSVTIKQLMTHSAGLSEIDRGEQSKLHKLSEIIDMVVKMPVQFPAGSKWQYSQTGINTGARIVEVISGEDFATFARKNIFEPLKMNDTTFYLNQDQASRLAKSYKRTEAGELEEAALTFLGEKKPTDTDRLPLANGGLFSTAGDYAKFCRMLIRGGELDGKRILKPETVRDFSQVHSGDLVTGFTPGNGWGIGCCVVRNPQGVSEHLSAGSFGHGGAYGTQAWIDPTRDRIYVLMVQRANFANSDASPVRAAFQKAAQIDLK